MPQLVVAIGASAGGMEILRELVSGLPGDFPGAVFVVLHIPPSRTSALPDILSASGPLRACHPKNGETIRPGRIYVAPPDRHLLIEKGKIAVTTGPRENRFRPSIDVLFRSAAYSYGARTAGVVLSGALDDGTSGFWTIKHLGGTTIVQHPGEARFDSMPLSALAQVPVDHEVAGKDIAPLLVRLASEKRRAQKKLPAEFRQRIRTEMDIAFEGGAFQKGIMNIGELTPFTCPECHGALVKLREGKSTRYRCHTGHGYSESALLDGIMDYTGNMLWEVIRSMEEGVMLLDHMADHMRGQGQRKRAAIYTSNARELEKRSKVFHELALKQPALSGDNVGRPSTKEA